ncbi:hypothetical protein [Maribacter arenosus]|uniref:ZU5 domain-containing protein n=1 Tax=Maribacter arenosus TaxID=1854708 RepID=A0ABR7V8X3_9FLAO|nr:hypothetical protein [Maribacter arenosus]MBD0849741.1 hypothetical protein [Maribacter arenosus]
MKKSAIIILSFVTIFFLSGCSKDSTNPIGNFDTNSNIIGINGGTITTDSGASIIIPPGALDSNTEITIRSFDTITELPENMGIMGEFAGGLVLGPDRLHFNIPVTITIPTNSPLFNANEVKLFYLDNGDASNSNYPANYAGWQQTDCVGTSSMYGTIVTAEIDHFSTYVIQMNFGDNTLDILGDMVETFGDNGLGVDFENYQTYFESTVANLDDLHVYDLPGGFGYDCYKVVGLEYILYHDLGVLFENPLYDFKGKKGEIAFYYNYEGDRSLVLNGSEQEFIYHLFINVYIDRTPPKLEIGTFWNVVEVGNQIDINGCLTCGSSQMKNQKITFSVNSNGSIDPMQQKTDSYYGCAEVTLTGNAEGIARVTGKYSAHNKEQIQVIGGLLDVVVIEEGLLDDLFDLECEPKPFVIDCPPIDLSEELGWTGLFDYGPAYFDGCFFTLDWVLSQSNYVGCDVHYVSMEEYCANMPSSGWCD